MDDSYGKVFKCMYTGSMLGAGLHVFAVWPWILAHKDEKGHLEINPGLLAHQLGCEEDAVVVALEYLQRPDELSRSEGQEGRRIIKLSAFEYVVVNHEKYRERGRNRTEYWREFKRAQRDKAKLSTVDTVDTCGQSTKSTHADADADADADAKKKRPLTPKGGKGGGACELVLAAWNRYAGRSATKGSHHISWHGHRKLSPEIIKGVESRLKDYAVDDIVGAIENYATVLLGTDSYWTYSWTLPDFLTRKQDKEKGSPLQIVRFLPDNFHAEQWNRRNEDGFTAKPVFDAEATQRRLEEKGVV